MNVLHVISGLDPRAGGTTSALAGMVRAQHDAGLNVAVLSTHTRDLQHDTIDQLKRHGIDVTLVGPTRPPLHGCPGLAGALRSAIHATDVVHIHGLWEQVQHEAARLATRSNKPYVISPHGMLDPWSLAQSRLRKRLYLAWRLRRHLERAQALHFTTETERDLTRPLGLHTPALVEPLGLHLEEYTPPSVRGQFRRTHPQLADHPMLLFMGRLHPRKGIDLLLSAMADLEHRHARLVFAGPDTHGYRARAETQARQLGLSERVLFTGMLEKSEKLAALADADLFVLPSEHENFGIVVIEALAMDTPVLVSDRVALAPALRPAAVGAVLPLDADTWTRAIDQWLGDPARRNNAARHAQPVVRERYDWRMIGERWRHHYQGLLARAR